MINPQAELIKAINKQNWKFAKTYATKAPHEYIMADWNYELYSAILNEIKEHGYTKYWHDVPFRYIDIDGYKYWHHGFTTLNREPLAGYSPADIKKFMRKGWTNDNPKY